MQAHSTVSRFLTTIVTTALITTIAPRPSHANLPVTIDTDNETWTLRTTVPDTDASAYGGRLRVQDVHMAKMVSVTYRHCNNSRYKAAFWRYYAKGELIAKFRFSCDLARELVQMQGLGASEPTTINLIGVGESTTDIPTLDIQGDNTDRWLKFTRNFKSMR